ncbi:MAG: hypothetical protein PHF00_09765 [Elusimicrobia bacterium]|nr:hypothetical protein [Elusimicrobiota bacterium]
MRTMSHVPAGENAFMLDNKETLALGRRSVVDSEGYRLELLLEGVRSESRSSAPEESSQAVPLLR